MHRQTLPRPRRGSCVRHRGGSRPRVPVKPWPLPKAWAMAKATDGMVAGRPGGVGQACMFQGVEPRGSRPQKALPSTSLPYSTKASLASALALQYSACKHPHTLSSDGGSFCGFTVG